MKNLNVQLTVIKKKYMYSWPTDFDRTKSHYAIILYISIHYSVANILWLTYQYIIYSVANFPS